MDSSAMVSPASADAEGVIVQWLTDVGWGTADSGIIDYAPGRRPGEHIITVPGERKLRTTISVRRGPRRVRFLAFVIRRPDENREEFAVALLRRNAGLAGVAFAMDDLGDVYLRGELRRQGFDVAALDDMIGVIAAAADAAFNPLLEIGFRTAIRREHAWRVARGEPTANLDAFRHLFA